MSLSCASLFYTETIDCLVSANSHFISPRTAAFATTKLFDWAGCRFTFSDSHVADV